MIRREVLQAISELEIAKAFLHESGTDPEAWIDGVLDRLRRLAAAEGELRRQSMIAWQSRVHDLVYGSGRESWFSCYDTGYRDGFAATRRSWLARVLDRVRRLR